MDVKYESETMWIIAQQQEVISALTMPAHSNDAQNIKIIAQQLDVISTLTQTMKTSNQPSDVNKPEMLRLEMFMKIS